MSSYDSAVTALKDFLLVLSNSKASEPRHLKTLYNALYSIYQLIDESPESSLVSSGNLAVLEDVCLAKNFVFSKTILTVILSIYGKLCFKLPGYGVRNVLGNHLNLLNGKNIKLSFASQECCILVIGEFLKTRSSDIGSLLNDIFQTIIRVLKGADPVNLRISCLRSLKNLLIGNGPGISDCHIEALKTATKFQTDRNPEVRLLVAEIIAAVCVNSKSFDTVPSDFLLQSLSKGLEDEVASVQDAYASSTAQVYVEQIKIYTVMQEASKIGAARGGSSEDNAKSAAKDNKNQSAAKKWERLSIAKISDIKSVLSGAPKKTEDFDFKTVVSSIAKLVGKTIGILRIAYITVLGYIIRELISSQDDDIVTWTFHQVVSILSDPAIAALSYEEILYIRARLSFLIRNSLSMPLNETGQIKLASIMTQYVASVETRTDQELQLTLFELSHIVCVLGDASKSMIDDINLAVNMYIRHASFGVRSASANVLASISKVAPSMAHQILSQTLATAQNQIKQLLVFENDGASSASSQGSAIIEDDNSQHGKTAPPLGSDSAPVGGESSTSIRRKSPKDAERMQRMYCFHGQILVMSLILKNEQNIRTGISKRQASEIFDFGLSLLKYNLSEVPTHNRNIICSIVRAGSLIVSSCLNLDFIFNQNKVYSLLSCCHEIIKIATGSNSMHEDEIIYEIMIIEAGLVCISTIIWRHADLVASDEKCRDWIVESLELSFRSVKSKYQPKFRTNFRFRTLHCILLESFAWLPPVFFSNSSQQVFVEALRVFRDCLSSGNECSCLENVIPEEFFLLGLNSSNKVFSDIPSLDRQFVLKLENYSIPLQKKEFEAFLAVFGKDSLSEVPHPSDFYSNPECPWFMPVSPSADIDCRTIDAAIMTIASTCSMQSHEYQDKAMTLFSQAITQVIKPPSGSISVFTSSEESRRREKRNYITIKNIVAVLSYLARSLPNQREKSDIDALTWIPNIVDRLLEILVFNSWDVKVASSYALSTLMSKLDTSSELIESFYSRVQKLLSSALEKKNENMNDYIGHVLLLGKLWVFGENHNLLRDRIVATLLDCLRRLDTSLNFKSSVFISIFLICDFLLDKFQKTSPDTLSEWFPLLVNVAHVMELHSAVVSNAASNGNSSIQGVEDLDLFFSCISKLNASLVTLSVGCLPYSQTLLPVILSSFKIFDLSSKISSLNCSEITNNNLLYLNRLIPVYSIISSNTSSVKNDISSLISWNVIFSFWFSIIENRDNFPLKTLKLIIDGINLSIKFFPVIVSKSNSDIYLFSLLNWIYSFQCVSPLSALTGLESRLFYNLDFVAWKSYNELVSSIQGTILNLISSEIAASPDSKALYWFLCCRALTLGLRSSGGVSPENEEKEDSEGFSAGNDRDRNNSELAIFRSKVAFSGTTTQELLAKIREIAIERMEPVASSRYRIKTFAVKCATVSLDVFEYAIKDKNRKEIHIQLDAARAATARNISASPNSSIFDHQFYLILFLHDLINMACSNATYTINDKISSSLIEESTLLLERLLLLFNSSRDPDFIHNNQQANDKEDKLLNQYISQIISAIRPSLSETWHPAIFDSTGRIVVMLLKNGLVRDKIVVKRLVKSLMSFAEENTEIISSFQTLPSVSEEIYTEKYLSNAVIASKLFLLAKNSPSNTIYNLEKSIKDSICQVVEPLLFNMYTLWKGIAIDSSRILSLSSLSNIDSEHCKRSSKEIINKIKNSGFDANVIHPQRGGFTFSYMSDIATEKMRNIYIRSGNISLVAAVNSFCSLTQVNQDASSLRELFTLLCLALESMVIDGRDYVDFCILAEIIQSFYLLSEIKSSTSIISLLEWATVLRKFRISGILNNNEFVTYSFTPFVSFLESLSKIVSSEDDIQLVTELSNSANFLLSVSFPHAVNIDNELSKGDIVYLKAGEFNSSAVTLLKDKITLVQLDLISNSLVALINLTSKFNLANNNLSNTSYILIRLLLVVSIFWPSSNQSRATIISSICSYLVSEQFQNCRPKLLSRILNEIDNFEMPSDMLDSLPSSMETMIGAWALICNLTTLEIQEPTMFSKIIWNICDVSLNESQRAKCKAIVLYVSKIIQSDNRNCHGVLSLSTCPSLFSILKILSVAQLSNGSYVIEDQSLLLLLQLSFILYSRSVEANRSKFLSILFPIICDLWTTYSSSKDAENSQWGIFVGVAITSLARNAAELVRDNVALLSETHKLVLQTIIKSSMVRQQSQSDQQARAASNSSAGSISVKKIDLSKFKKADS